LIDCSYADYLMSYALPLHYKP